MRASYKKLWKLLVDKDMSKGDLHKASGLSSSTMTKLRKGEDVSMEAPRKNCVCLGCNIGDIVEFADESKQKSVLLDNQCDMITMGLGNWLGWRSEWKNQMVPSRAQPKAKHIGKRSIQLWISRSN